MAITESVGYGGDVDENEIPSWSRGFQGSYGVIGPDAWKVTVKTGVDRTLVVAPGDGYGKGIRDTNDLVEATVTLDTLAAGSTRWDMVVAHRNTNGPGGVTTFSFVKGVVGSKYSAFGSRKRFEDDETLDDQPLALVQVTGNGGGGVLGTVIDLRVWTTGSGAYAESEDVMQYLNDIGTSIWIGTTLWHCGRSPLSGAAAWFPVPMLAPLNFFGAGSAMVGVVPPSPQFLLQAGTVVRDSDAAGNTYVAFPNPFPNGCLIVIPVPGDDYSNPDLNANAYGYTREGFSYRTWRGEPQAATYERRTVAINYRHRVNYIAIGW